MKTEQSPVKLAKSAGFCHGVRRAIEIAKTVAAEYGGCYTLGSIIHNRHVVAELELIGIHAVNEPCEVPEGAHVVIRSHGVPPEVLAQLGHCTVHDATCPDVARIHKVAENAADSVLLIIGDPEHPEVLGTLARAEAGYVADSQESLKTLLKTTLNTSLKPVTAVAQTTVNIQTWSDCVDIIKKCCTNAKIIDTICKGTLRRQKEALSLAGDSDTLIVVGDEQSSNTRHLVELCKTVCGRVYLVSGALELDGLNLSGRVGLTAGASASPEMIKEVYIRVMEEQKNIEQGVVQGAESFEDLLEASLKTLTTGDKVKGIVTAITPTEIHVELGTKQAGYIPVAEFSSDPDAKPEELIKVGDEIETYVMRVSDVEGTAMLSKRRLDAVADWDKLENASGTGDIVEGIVTEINKGGLVVSVRGIRVFVPSSQTGVPKDADMDTMLKKRVRLRITEVTRARRRVVGSIRAVANEERRAKSEQVWNNIQVGACYNGTVRSLTAYGAFVDIGGVDGMVHVSELSWSRVSKPGDVLKVGDPLTVYVLNFDKEKRKISLTCKKSGENPWVKFTEQYHTDDVCEVRVVKLMPYGAFCEIIPGVDGLIHISQLADRHIATPSEVVKEGQTLRVQITEIDYSKQKISLSARLADTAAPEETPGETPEQE